jgi:hemolysin activation/secretion protein
VIRRRSLATTVLLSLCLYFAVDELYEPGVTTNTGAWLRQVEKKTGLPATEWARKLTGQTYKLPDRSDPSLAHHDLVIDAHPPDALPSATVQTPPVTPVNAHEDMSEEMVSLKQIRFKGANALGPMALGEVVKPFLDRPLKYEELLEITVTVESFYRKNNFVARVTLMPQDLTDGVLILEVIESILSDVEVEKGLEMLPNTQKYALAMIEKLQAKGEPLNTERTDRAIAMVNQIPGVTAEAALRSGKEVGETDLVLNLYQTAKRKVEAMFDNYGSYATGVERATANLTLFNPGDLADMLNLTGVTTRGSEYVRAAYSWAVGNAGWRMGVNLTHMTYEVVKGMTVVVGAKGQALTQGIEMSYPLATKEEHSSKLTLNFDEKEYTNTSAQGVNISNYKVNTATAEVSGVARDMTPGGALATYSVQATQGTVNLDGSLSQLSDTAHVQGQFAKLKATATVLQPLASDLSVYGSLTAQRANKNLDSSEKISLGGISGVRAYPTGEGAGSDGEIATIELRYNLNESTTISGFYDWGRVSLMHDANFPGGPKNNSYMLSGYGMGLTHTTPRGVQYRAIWARRDSENPNPTQTGQDQDGTLDRNRFWLQILIPF